MLNWEECTAKIGSLPLLEYLRLDWNACCGEEWKTVEGQFCSLKVLRIEGCCNLRNWITDSTHFPCLEHLLLRFLVKLEEIPFSIGDIPMLKSIRLDGCSRSTASAKRIEEEQRELGNTDLQLHIIADDCAQKPTSNDAFSYAKEVKETFQYRRESYDRFLDILKYFKGQSFDTIDVISELKVLFKGHPNLILGFSIFLPKEYGIILNRPEDNNIGEISQSPLIQNNRNHTRNFLGTHLMPSPPPPVPPCSWSPEPDCTTMLPDCGHLKKKLRRGLWSPEEDEKLNKSIITYGVGCNWIRVPLLAGLQRSGEQCRLRYLNYIMPHLPKRRMSPQEEEDFVITLLKFLETS